MPLQYHSAQLCRARQAYTHACRTLYCRTFGCALGCDWSMGWSLMDRSIGSRVTRLIKYGVKSWLGIPLYYSSQKSIQNCEWCSKYTCFLGGGGFGKQIISNFFMRKILLHLNKQIYTYLNIMAVASNASISLFDLDHLYRFCWVHEKLKLIV